MDIKTELRRAEFAAQVLESPVYREAYEQIERNIVNRMAQATTSDEDVQRLRYTLVGLRTVRKWMENVIATGHMVEMEEATKHKG